MNEPNEQDEVICPCCNEPYDDVLGCGCNALEEDRDSQYEAEHGFGRGTP